MIETINLRKLLWPTPLAIFGAAVINLIWYYIASALFPESVAAAKAVANEFSAVIATIAYWIVGLVLLVVVAKLSKKPITHFTYLAIAALIVSFAFPFMAAQGELPNGASIDKTMILVLEVMHIIAATVALPLVLKWVREN
ncbi:MAG: DUF6069 family protein [Chloroflexi bacterium]|nr:DUF6069 family protein [Chloroflexota bacterium]